jgi:class 3 adenylate cyclase
MSYTPERCGSAHKELICCLLALEIADYDAKPVFDQVRLTQDFHNLLSDVMVRATSHDLVSVVGEDGALLGFLAGPEECFTTALTLREAALTQDDYRDLPLRIGINLGEAQIAEDEFGHPHVTGEGRRDADRLMRQGPPGQISVARHFVELLSSTAPELAELLEYQGLYSDGVGPPLCLYRVSAPQDAGSERPPTPVSGVIDALTRSDLAPITAPAQSVAKSRNWSRRSWLGYALLPLLAGAAIVTLSSRLRVEAPVSVSSSAAQVAAATPRITVPGAPASLPAPVAPAEMTQSAATTLAVLANDPKRPRPASPRRAKPMEEAAPAAPRIEESASATFNNAAASEERLEPERRGGADQPAEVASVQPPRSATLFLAVKPWGEVYVDGRKMGVTPPLRRFEVPLGRHLITITNSSLPIYQREVAIEPDTEVTVAHDFSCVSTRDKICREGFGKGLQLHSRFRLETAEAAHPQ